MKLRGESSSPLFNAIISSLFENKEEKVVFKGEEYTLFWTPHSCLRTEKRIEKSFKSTVKNLINLISEIDKSGVELNAGYTAIRDFVSGIFYIIHTNKKTKKIRCVTCGGVNEIYPYENDFVIQRNMNYKISSYIWKRK